MAIYLEVWSCLHIHALRASKAGLPETLSTGPESCLQHQRCQAEADESEGRPCNLTSPMEGGGRGWKGQSPRATLFQALCWLRR